MHVRDLMTAVTETLWPGFALQAAARRLRRTPVLPVCHDGRLLRLLTQRDCDDALGVGAGLTVRDVMTEPLSCCDAETVEDAAAFADARGTEYMAVLDASESVVGLVSSDELIRQALAA